MSNTDPAFIAPPIGGAAAAVLTIAAAVPIIEERLGRVKEIERQVGKLPRLVYAYYVNFQHFYKWGLLSITFVGFIMVCAFIYRLAYPSAPMYAWLETLQVHGLELVIAWFVFGFVMYTNFFSRLGKWLGFVLTLPPVLRTIFGTDRLDRHPAWQALNEFINSNKNAKPLIISHGSAQGFADGFIQILDRQAMAPENRAEPPVMPAGADPRSFRQRMSNALLAGCIIEEAHYLPNAGFPKRKWGPLYRNLQDLAASTELLTVHHLKSRIIGNDFSLELLANLNKRLAACGQPEVPASPTLIQNLTATLNALVMRYGADAAAIDPERRDLWRSQWDIIRARVSSLPSPSSESMRVQFMKLAVVWGIWTNLDLREFYFAFSKRVAALMLDRSIIRVPSDVKSLRFDTDEERQVARAAEKIIISAAQRLVDNNRPAHEAWLPPQSRNTSGDLFRWWVAYEIDLRTWDYAKALHENENIPAGEALTRWRANGQVAPIA
jgi:hypothetical protein